MWVWQYCWVLGVYYQFLGIWVVVDFCYYFVDLVDYIVVYGGLVVLLFFIYGVQIFFWGGLFVLDIDVVFFQIVNVGVVGQKLEQFMDNGFQVYFFGGYQGKVVGQVELYLVVE